MGDGGARQGSCWHRYAMRVHFMRRMCRDEGYRCAQPPRYRLGWLRHPAGVLGLTLGGVLGQGRRMVFALCIFVAVLGGGVWWWRAWNERRRLEALPEKDRNLVELMRRGATAMKNGDAEAQSEVLRAIGELGTGASVAFIADWLSNKSVSLTWPDLLKGIVEGAENAEPQWKDGVFRALEQGLEDPSTPNLFHGWPFVSWPAAMMAVDAERAVKAFAERELLVLGAPGFSAAVAAINDSASVVVPADIAAHWLPATMPDLKQQGVGDEYLLMLRAHAEHDLPEAQRRLWEVVNEGGKLGEEAALLLLKVEGLPDPVWRLDSRVQEIGLDKVRPAERTVWTVANWFTPPSTPLDLTGLWWAMKQTTWRRSLQSSRKLERL